MVRRRKGGSKTNLKKRVKGDEGSDDSDEDYVVSDKQSDASEDEQTDASENALEDLAGSVSVDGKGEFFNDEVLNEDDGVNDDDFEDEVEEEEEEEDEGDEMLKSEMKRGSSGPRKSGGKTSRKRNRVSLEEESDDDDDEDEDYDANNESDEDDEEFTPDEDDCLVDEEDYIVKKRNRSKLEMYKKLGRCDVRKKVTKSGRKRRKKLAALKNLTRKKGRKIKRTRMKASLEYEDEDDDDFAGMNRVMGERGRTLGRSKRRYIVRSDSDFMSSGPSDFEYTVSEEEREQVREASEICKNMVVTPPRRSSPSRERCTKGGYLRMKRVAPSSKTEEGVQLPQQRKSSGIKGKQKVEEVIKQICGICFSEEDKRRVQGTLDCCSHYFCFACIMEWSKVESRCPLCKQRFKTITKPARSAAGVDLRDVVIQVQERDQVYQPSEDEIRGYLDPYENVICTECHKGGDDGLMLLCDLCDSPAHTYCVGLGREVPEGDWYCEGCRLGALGSSGSHLQDPTLFDQRTGIGGGEHMDLNMAPSPLPFTGGVGSLASQRFNGVINQAASLFSGAGATTVSGRRMIQRHIHQILIGHRVSAMASRVDGISADHVNSDPPNSYIDQSLQTPVHQLRNPEIRASFGSIFGERSHEIPSPSLRGRDSFLSSQNTLRREGVEEPLVMPQGNSYREISFDDLGGRNDTTLAPGQLPQSTNNWPSLGPEFAASPHVVTVREESHFYRAKEQVQSMVRNHLKSFSEILGPDDLTDIARSSTHTILAACGLDPRKTEVHTGPLPPPPTPPSGCMHSEVAACGQTSLIKGLCWACFDVYVGDVVECIKKTRSRQWLSLGL